MKSAIVSLLVLILIVLLFKYGFLALLSSKMFHYSAYIIFAIVMASAVYFVGIRDNNKSVDVPENNSAPEVETNEK